MFYRVSESVLQSASAGWCHRSLSKGCVDKRVWYCFCAHAVAAGKMIGWCVTIRKWAGGGVSQTADRGQQTIPES